MIEKVDPVTGEKFECGADTGKCWCADLPNQLPVPDKTADCVSPTRLRQILEDSTSSDPAST